MLHKAPGWPHQYMWTSREEDMVFAYNMKGVHGVHHPPSAMGRNCLATGDQHALPMLTLLHLFSHVWGKPYSNQCLVCWGLLGDPEPIEDAVGWGLWAPSHDGHCDDLCLPSWWDGGWIFLFNIGRLSGWARLNQKSP